MLLDRHVKIQLQTLLQCPLTRSEFIVLYRAQLKVTQIKRGCFAKGDKAPGSTYKI